MKDWLNKKLFLIICHYIMKICIVLISYKLLYRIKCRRKNSKWRIKMCAVINISDIYNSNISIIGFSYKSLQYKFGLAEEEWEYFILLTIPITNLIN
jgi:hypothetical protein